MEKKRVKTITGICVCKGSTWYWSVDYPAKLITLVCTACGRTAHFRLVDPGADIKRDVLITMNVRK